MRQFFLILIFFLTTSAATAQDPFNFEFNDPYVNDYADLLEDTARQDIQAKVANLYVFHGVEFTVVTIRAMNHHSDKRPMSAFAEALFDKWAKGNPSRSNGAILIVSRFDQSIWVQVGPDYGTRKNEAMRNIVFIAMMPLFRQYQYQNSILEGVDKISASLIDQTEPQQTSPDVSVGKPDAVKPALEPSALLNWVKENAMFWGGIVLGLIFLSLIPRLFRTRGKTCPRDGNKMQLLTEDESKVRQKTHQGKDRGAKRCRVWLCDHCDHVVRQAENTIFSRFGACRSCGTKAIEGDSCIVKNPSKITTGQRRVDYTCKNCHAGYSSFLNIPRLPRTQA